VEELEHAIEMEKEAEKYYRDLAEKAVNPGLKSIMMLLAGEEARHHAFYKALAESPEAQMDSSELISAVKQVFLKMKEAGDTSGIDVSEVALYKKVLEAEREHCDFYNKKAGAAKDEMERRILLKIAEEEKRHAMVLENIVDFVSRPDEWLENAEWYHLEEY
jgi:rubrerythrin